MTTPAPLYLDAARLGAMSPTAQLAARDFARLAGEGLSTLYWEEFFRGRFSRASRYPGLASWQGNSSVADAVRGVLSAPSRVPVLFASRTAALMQAAVEQLASCSRRILTTDSLWPSYRDHLDEACRRHARTVVTLPVRAAVTQGRWTRRGLVERVVRQFAEARCDGAFLSSVSHDGIRLPLAAIVAGLREHYPQAFIAIDGAQEFAHVPVRLAAAPCDVYVAGCHKWLAAHQPLGLAVLAHPPTATEIAHAFRDRLDDPLFRYVESLESNSQSAPAETVNLAPLICAHGALADVAPDSQRRRFRQQLRSARRTVTIAECCGWIPYWPRRGLRTGILMLHSRERDRDRAGADDLQREFWAAGIILTAYAGGVIRLSLPGRPLPPTEWGRLRSALWRLGAGHSQPLIRRRDPSAATP